ncbi:succinate dehydrogenase, cytochrome b556 subunit [Sinimarinibacterium sp. NLF-5-8]|nr:succinate dehydrogenase, cytochrome b556 subunit [Sinimarinibacterium sp. NLF-5-8]
MSPFMLGQYYRFQITSLLSFAHRSTGVGLVIGALLLVSWLVAIAGGPQWYAAVSGHVTAWYGQVLLFAWTWAVCYHLCNGIRHLFWDIGRGFDIKTATATGYLVVAASFICTAALWALACFA